MITHKYKKKTIQIKNLSIVEIETNIDNSSK